MTKYYNAETRNSLEMQFGSLVCKKIVIEKKYVYAKRIDTRTKQYGNQRKHDGEIGKYKINVKKKETKQQQS